MKASEVLRKTRELSPTLIGLELDAATLRETANTARRKRERESARARLVKVCAEIERQATLLKLSVPLADNGVHVFYETDSYLVLRNHGSAFWAGMFKLGRSFRVVTSGQLDPEKTLAITRAADLAEKEEATS